MFRLLPHPNHCRFTANVSGSKCFSTLDESQAYMNIPVRDQDGIKITDKMWGQLKDWSQPNSGKKLATVLGYLRHP